MFPVNKVQGASGQETTMDADADLSGAPETFLQNKIKRFEKWDRVKFCHYWFFGTKTFTCVEYQLHLLNCVSGGTGKTVELSGTSASPSSCSGSSSLSSSSTQSSRWFLNLHNWQKKILCFRQLFPCQATEHHHQPEWLDEFQEYTNLIFLSLFTLEMLMKMYAMSFSVRDWVRLLTYCWY